MTQIWMPLVLALTLAGSLAGCQRPKAAKPATQPSMAPVAVSIAPARLTPVARELVISGTIIARSQVVVMPKTTGRVKELLIREGQRVQRGQVLAVLDTPELEWQLQQQQGGLISAQANADNTQDNLARMRELAAEGVISQSQLKLAETQAKVASSQLRQAKTAISLMQTQLANGTITSPIDGIVLARGVELGSMAMPSTAVVTLAERGELQVKLPVAERDLGYLREGGAVMVRTVALPGAQFRGTIAEIAPMVDPQSRLIPVKVDLTDAGRLKVGMNVTALLAAEPHQGLTVPTEAVLTDGAEQIVYLGKGTTAARVPITVGITNPHATEVLTGLTAGDPVIVKGNAFLKDGYPIRQGGAQ